MEPMCSGNAPDRASTWSGGAPDGDCGDLGGWERLLEQRRRLHRRLGAALRRPPGELLMNAGDEGRPVREDKLLLEATAVPQHFDPYRGNPAFWHLPPGLPVPCRPRANPVHFYTPTRAQRNELPDLVHVGVPDPILEEKDLMPRSRNLYKSWKNLKYRQERAAQLDDKIKHIEPHKPEMENLLVIGKGIRLEEADGNSDDTDQESAKGVDGAGGPIAEPTEEVPRIAVMMNGVTITEATCRVSTPTITVNTSIDITASRLVVQDLTITNIGRTAVRFSWQKHKRHSLFADLSRDENYVPHFFFDINDVIVIPNQTTTIPVVMKVTAPRSYSETWRIRTRPGLSQRDYHILFRISCYGYIRGLETRATAIVSRIDTATRNNVIKEVIRDVLGSLRYTTRPLNSLHYTEEQLFESINYNDNVLQRNKKYVYNKVVIDKLKEFYERAWHEGWPEQWNLCLEDLKRLARQADLKAYAEAVKVKTHAASQANEQLQKQRHVVHVDRHPSKEVARKKSTETSRNKLKDVPVKSSSSGIKSVEKTSSSKVEKGGSKSRSQTAIVYESAHKRLHLLLNQLRKPDMLPNLEREKYSQLFSVAGTYITKICYDSELLQCSILRRFTPSNVSSYSVNQERPQRLIYEFFDDTFLLEKSHRLVLKKNSVVEAPRADFLKDIPDDDIDKIYELYCSQIFGLSDKQLARKSSSKTAKVQDKKKANKGAKAKDAKKSTKDKSSTQSLKKTKTDHFEFDPFAEQLVVSPGHQHSKEIKRPSVQKVETSCSNVDLSLYSHNLYVTFYAYLCQAVDELLVVCDQLRSDMVAPRLVHELVGGDWRCGKISAARYKALMRRQIGYPPATDNLEEDEGIKTHMVKGIVKPTKAETRKPSLWSILQNYIPEPETPPEPVQTPVESVVEEPSVKDMDVQASLPFETSDSTRSDGRGDFVTDDSKGSTQPSSSISFQYFYVDE